MDFIPVLSAEPCEVRRQQPNGTSKTKRLITAKRNRKVRTWKQLNEEDSKCMRKTVIVRLLVHCSLASSVRPPFTTFPRSTRSQPSSLTSVRFVSSLVPRSSLRSCHSPLVVGAVRYAEPGSRRPPHHTPVGRRIGGPAGLRRMGVW